MIRDLLIAMLLCAGSIQATCQSTFIVHMDSVQDGYAADGRSILETASGYIILGHQISNDGSGRLTAGGLMELDLAGLENGLYAIVSSDNTAKGRLLVKH